MAGYRELKVWQEGIEFACGVYEATQCFPSDERFGLISQMRRAAVSVSSNIAEGHARNSPQEMVRFCSIALGSVAELDTQLTIASKLGYGEPDHLQKLSAGCDKVSRMLHGLIRSNRERSN